MVSRKQATYFFRPWSISVWPTQMPCVSTLTTPFLNEKRSGRTSATKLTGSWRKIPEKSEGKQVVALVVKLLLLLMQLQKKITINTIGLHMPISVEFACITYELSISSFRLPQTIKVGIWKHNKLNINEKNTSYGLWRSSQRKEEASTRQFDLCCNVDANNINICTRSEHDICGFWVPEDLHFQKKN